MKTLQTLLMMTAITHLACNAAQTKPVQSKANLQQVALFKNGLGFFVSEVKVPDDTTTFQMTPCAAPSHGTFWVSYPKEVQLERLVAKESQIQEEAEAVSIPDLLKANVGKYVKLYFSDPDEATIEGTIVHVSQDRKIPRPQPYAPGAVGAVVDNRRYGYAQANLIIIDTTNGQIAINPNMVRRVDFLGEAPGRMVPESKESMQLDIELAAPANGQRLQISYLGKGVTWVPSYIVDISEEENARISAKAVVINEVCDFDDVTLQLVTGFPHLQFADIVSPLAMKENLAQFLDSLTRGESERGRRTSVTSNVMVQSPVWGMGEDRSRIMPGYGAAEGGKVSEDLFFYPIKNVRLAKDQVGYFPLFTEKVPYTHIYQWKIPDYVNVDDRYRWQRPNPQEAEPEEEIWHSIRLENVSNVPWTTAPAQILKDGLILGQDTLKYTPVKGETTVPITRAVSVNAEQIEFETQRQRDAMRMYGDQFDLITIQGKLSVTNFLNKDITLEITKTLSGDVKSTEPEAKVKKLARGLLRVNATAELTWTIDLEPKQDKELTYTYDVYVRR
ncbi:MAG: DUF4139 domain-containing protein [Phycisphaerae bacterium]|nr:DUF4139 domain-containing protein [Phycisphaerae bacterium]